MMKQFHYFNDNDPWMLAEEIPDIDFQFSQIWLSSFVNELDQTVGRNYKKVLCEYRGYNLTFYYGEKDSLAFAEHILNLLKENPEFGDTINQNIRHYSDQLKEKAREITPQYLKVLTQDNLASLYKDLDALHTTLYTWGWLPNAVDMFHGNFTNYLRSVLEKKVASQSINEVLVTLSASEEKSILDLERESFLHLVKLKQMPGKAEEFQEALQTHCNNYFYLKHLWIGKEGVYTLAYYQEEVEKFIKSGEKAEQVLNQKHQQAVAVKENRNKIIQELNLSPSLQHLFKVYAEFSVTKVYRRDAQLLWAYHMDFLFAELSNRLNLPIMQVRFLFPEEVVKGLRDGIPNALVSELEKRTQRCIYYAEKGIDSIFVGKEAEAISQKLVPAQHDKVTELRGQAACLGKARGKVRIINSVADMVKMEPGDILVSIATNPDIVPAMKKAGAIVTEQGGITSHAAIVSRELGVPCVIGTKIATRVLKDGEMVEVDANQAMVTRIVSA